MPAKNYGGHIYIKNDLQEILHSEELNTISSSTCVLFFPTDVTLEQAKEALKILRVNIDDQIRKRDGINGCNEER